MSSTVFPRNLGAKPVMSFSSCWKNAVARLQRTCTESLTAEDTRSRVALAFTACQLRSDGKSDLARDCPAFYSVPACTEQLDDRVYITWCTCSAKDQVAASKSLHGITSGPQVTRSGAPRQRGAVAPQVAVIADAAEARMAAQVKLLHALQEQTAGLAMQSQRHHAAVAESSGGLLAGLGQVRDFQDASRQPSSRSRPPHSTLRRALS
jgi:hypothetical protein